MEEHAQRARRGHETHRGPGKLARLDTATHVGESASETTPDSQPAPGVHLNGTSRDDVYEDYWDDVTDDGDDPAYVSGNRVAGSGLRVLGVLAVVYGVYFLGGWVTQRSTKPALVGPITPTVSMTTPAIVVHVAGRVHKPGVYTLPPNARVRDAVLKAGGPLRDADINAINLAAWAEDGSKIEVPLKPQSGKLQPAPVIAQADPITDSPEPASDIAPASTAQSEVKERVAEPTVLPTPKPEIRARSTTRSEVRPAQRTRAGTRSAKAKIAAGVPRATTASGQESVNASPEYLAKHPLNLNRARAEQLEILPGIGPSLAQKIVAYREQNGGFKSVDDLDNVSGIGPKKLEALRPLVTVQ